ncbi:hypothetical protein [Rhodoplanes sp. Z2-YC6860]|uniref:hypothetical protein n=1 Tax=Rhodoplanes sp. Z2-YC6860 TaxID=674703 RepID=UPI00083319F9|nr:hypothetical protein [Rhodoplanes sp. Z2-YC6860]
MDRFIARENIKHFQEVLLSDIRPEERARIQGLLIEEEDKFGKNLELLAHIERHIADGARRIQQQMAIVRTMRINSHSGLDRAQAFLDGMLESQNLHMDYRHRVVKEIEQSRL